MEIDIYSKGKYPSSALSNFAEHHFFIDGVECRSMEGFLQSLKYRKPEEQKKICSLVGKNAKKAGEKSVCGKCSRPFDGRDGLTVYFPMNFRN